MKQKLCRNMINKIKNSFYNKKAVQITTSALT